MWLINLTVKVALFFDTCKEFYMTNEIIVLVGFLLTGTFIAAFFACIGDSIVDEKLYDRYIAIVDKVYFYFSLIGAGCMIRIMFLIF